MADDRHTVLFIPGFLAPDSSNLPLAAVAKRAGCKPKRSGLGTNSGPTPRVIEHLERRLEAVYRERGRVTLVGVSLGGIFARRLARSQPDHVRQVISIGSPFRFDPTAGRSVIIDRLWQNRVDTFDPEALEELQLDEERKVPLRVPSTSIFSRMDRVVPFKHALVSPAERSENIEVKYSGHLGLIIHPGVHLILSDRVGQPVDDWQPFRIPRAARSLIKHADFYDPNRAKPTKGSDPLR